MISEHADAFLALLTADPNLTVFDGNVPDNTDPGYVVVWISVDNEESVSLADEQGKPNIRVTTHSVADTGTGARIIADRVRSAVHNKRLTIAGRNCWKVRHDYGIPPQPDQSTGRAVIDAVDVWTFASVTGS